MTIAIQDLKDTVKEFLLREFLPGEHPDQLLESTPLFSGGVLDSLAMVKFVGFLEDRYGIDLKPYDITPDRFDTIPQIAGMVHRKLAQRPPKD